MEPTHTHSTKANEAHRVSGFSQLRRANVYFNRNLSWHATVLTRIFPLFSKNSRKQPTQTLGGKAKKKSQSLWSYTQISDVLTQTGRVGNMLPGLPPKKEPSAANRRKCLVWLILEPEDRSFLFFLGFLLDLTESLNQRKSAK